MGDEKKGVERVADIPSDRRYTSEHEWALEDDGRVTVGITDYAQDQLGDVVYVGLPEVGAEVEAGKALGEVESTKSVSDIYSPVTGRVIDRNAEVEHNPELVNEDPYGRGWLVVIEPSAGPWDELLDADGYRRLLDEA